MIFSHGDWGLPNKERTSLNLGKFQTCASSSAQVLAKLALALLGFLSRSTCLPLVLAGGSTVHSNSQLQPNKSWSRIQGNRCRPAPLPSLTDSESLRAVQQRLGRQSVPAWTPLVRSVLQPTWLQNWENSSQCPDQWRHGWSRGRCWPSAWRQTSARRYSATLVYVSVAIYLVLTINVTMECCW